MSKIKIKVLINKEELETNAIITDNTIKYLESNNTSVIFNINDNTLVRENDDIYMKYDFNKGFGVLKIKELNKEIKLEIKNIKISKENDIEIKYFIEDEEFNYKLEVIK